MPPVPVAQFDWWDTRSQFLQLDCLLPTGIIIPLKVEKEATIEEIKQSLWNEAQLYPLFSALRGKHTYVFQCITSMAEKVELEDENQRLGDIKPFQPILKVVERKGNKYEKITNLHISLLIGKGLHEFDNLKSGEVSDFRQTMRAVCERHAAERDGKTWLDKMNYLYPPDVSDHTQFPDHIRDKLEQSVLKIFVYMPDGTSKYQLTVPCSTKPVDLISQAIAEHDHHTGHNYGDCDLYALKVCGFEELLIGDYPMSQFMCIRRFVNKNKPPEVLMMNKTSLTENEPKSLFAIPSKPPIPQRKLGKKSEKLKSKTPSVRGTLSWDIPEKFSFQVNCVTGLNESNFTKFQICAGIYHGPDTMCSVVKSSDVMLNEGCVTWRENLEFDITLQDIPRMARLCLVLCVVGDKRVKDKRTPTGGKKKGRKESLVPHAWVNITLFDYKDILRSGPCNLYMWPIANDAILFDQEALLNPIGTVESNPMGGICLKINFHNFNTSDSIYFAPFEKVLEVAAKHTDFKTMEDEDPMESCTDRIQRHVSTIMLDERKNVNQQHLKQLKDMVDRDPLTELCEQEKERIWMLRFECQYHFPYSLPKLLRCVQWNNHKDVAQMQALLQIWPHLEPDKALELLDFDHANKEVRSFAVKCLKKISNLQLKQYLLQLVQVLKYESYLECDLVHFLLQRALNNQRIGHDLFWLLRSEMNEPSVSVRFGLILEAYCRGSSTHILVLSKQTMALDKLKTLSNNIKNEKTRQSSKEALRQALDEPQYREALTDLQSILNPAHRLLAPIKKECKVMDSKMKPLWLVFQNSDKLGEEIYVMYKNGDDLRQDMLTLQILRVIENIWQESGLDLRLNAYGCLSTAKTEGLIEVINETATLANIQKKYPGIKLKSAFNKQSLYMWLKTYNKTEEELEKAIKEFTYSCAGYSVAMYVLGVADRHGDNILLKQNGQLLHIDFGHFLGHFKSKFGLNREPAPFMLTSDLVYVIQRGEKKDSEAFNEFKKLCEDAYMALREKCHFLMTLFLMMINTGIPELSNLDDIMYLKKTLVPDLKEDKAREHFQKQMKAAIKNAWLVAVNNTFHNMMRDNN